MFFVPESPSRHRLYCPCPRDRPPSSPTSTATATATTTSTALGEYTLTSKKIPDLHAAVVMGDYDRVESILSSLESMQDLLKSRCPMGWTPLHYAVDHNQQECAALLLRRARNLSLFFEKDKKGWTPFHHACCQSTLCMSEFLLEKGGPAQIYARENLGKTALHLVCETTCSVPMAQLLIEKSGTGAALMYTRDFVDGSTPLHLAASQGLRALPLAELLLDKGGPEFLLEKITIDGSTPLQKAFRAGSLSMVELFFRKSKLSSVSQDPCMMGVKKRLLSLMLRHEGNVQCPVCLEDFGHGEIDHIVVMNCGHVVCTADYAHLKRLDAPKCPECRNDI